MGGAKDRVKRERGCVLREKEVKGWEKEEVTGKGGWESNEGEG